LDQTQKKMFYWPKRVMYECLGGKFVAKPVNPMNRHCDRNTQRLKDKQSELGGALFRSRKQKDKVSQESCAYYCTEEGEIRLPTEANPLEMANVLVNSNKLDGDSEEFRKYYIFAIPELVSDYMIGELIKTERGLNGKNRNMHWQQYVECKIKELKQTRGPAEARRWAIKYEAILDVKGVSGLYYIYFTL
jgi:hypothetical protein